MRPDLAKSGKSFKGAGQYYLHDKQADTKNRVAFTHVENVNTNDAAKALKVMAHTAYTQAELKREHYRRNNPDDPQCLNFKAGRPAKVCVMHYSLAWHPSETPDREHMIASVRETLKAMKLDEHQAVMVAHNDTPHPHIHVIVNTIHPITGKAAKVYKPIENLQAWSRAYERERGQNWSVKQEQERKSERTVEYERVHNAQPKNQNRKTQFQKQKHNQLKGRASKAEYYRWKRAQCQHDWEMSKEAGQKLWALQKAQRDRLFAMRDADIKRAKAAVRQKMKPEWAAHFKRERQQRADFERMMAHFAGRLAYLTMNGRQKSVGSNRGWLTAVWNAIAQPEKLRSQFEARMTAQKQALRDQHGLLAKEPVKAIYKRHKARFAAMKSEQTKERSDYNKALAEWRNRRSKDAPERFRQNKVAAAIAKGLQQRDGRASPQKVSIPNARPTTQPIAPSLPRPDAPHIKAEHPRTPSNMNERRDTRENTPHVPSGFAMTRQDKFAAHAKPLARQEAKPEKAPPVKASDHINMPPWTAYGMAPRMMLVPKGLRKPPVQIKPPPDPQHYQTPEQRRDEQQKREEAELMQIFGSVSKVRQVRSRAANGKVNAKSGGRGRVRKRGFKP